MLRPNPGANIAPDFEQRKCKAACVGADRFLLPAAQETNET